ncbi:hypothetical protein [Streptomyces sp. NPDC058964]
MCRPTFEGRRRITGQGVTRQLSQLLDLVLDLVLNLVREQGTY